MTLVELLAASALAALLMVGVVGVLRSLSTQRRVLFGDHPVDRWRGPLLEQFQWDLANARRMSAQPRGLRRGGDGGCEFDTGAVTHRPTEVIYSIRQEGGRSWLLRREIHLDASTLHNDRTELVCAGIGAMAVHRLDEDPEDPRGAASGREPRPGAAAAWCPVPDQLRLLLFGMAEGELVLNEAVCLR